MANEHDIYPRRLVFMQLGCMFCKEPKGETYVTHVALEAKMGYMSCRDCKEKMKAAVEFWRTHHAYGKAKHLKDCTDLKIKRSNGDMEAGWRLNNPMVHVEEDGTETIHCYNAEKDIGKWCYMNDVLEWNSL
jgi:hypothetical protein